MVTVPTLEEFAPRFLEGYAQANRQKPSGIAAKETSCACTCSRSSGTRRLDEITTEDVQRLKALGTRAPKTVNNVLTVLSVAAEDGRRMGGDRTRPCVIRMLRTRRRRPASTTSTRTSDS